VGIWIDVIPSLIYKAHVLRVLVFLLPIPPLPPNSDTFHVPLTAFYLVRFFKEGTGCSICLTTWEPLLLFSPFAGLLIVLAPLDL